MSGHAFNEILKFVLSDNTLAILSKTTFCDNISSVFHMHEKVKKTGLFDRALFSFIQYMQF